MRTDNMMITEPMVYKMGNGETMLSFTGAAEALVEMEHIRNAKEMEEALDRVKENYNEMVAGLPMLLEYEAEDKDKIHDTFWVLNNVRKFMNGIKVVRV